MKKRTLAELEQEIERVEIALQKTKSEHLQRDYMKYLKRLKREYKRGGGILANSRKENHGIKRVRKQPA